MTESRDTLKAFWKAGYPPSDGNLDDLIDAVVHLTEDIASDAQAKAETLVSKFLSPANLRQGAPELGAGSLAALFPQHYQITPELGTATAVHAAVTLANGETTTVTAAITNPDVPRTVTVKGNQAGVTGNAVITGTNIAGQPITDTIALSDDTEVPGVKAFSTVTQIVLPARAGAGDTVSVGVGDVFGLPHSVYNAAFLLLKLFDGSADTSGSLAVDDDELEKNLYTIAGTPDGAKLLDLVYLV